MRCVNQHANSKNLLFIFLFNRCGDKTLANKIKIPTIVTITIQGMVNCYMYPKDKRAFFLESKMHSFLLFFFHFGFK